jgi:hypothetical protein
MEADYRGIVILDFRQGKRIISYLKRQAQFFCLPSLQLNDYRRQITRGLKLTTRLQKVPRLSTCRSVRPLLCMSLLACAGQMLPLLLLLFYLFLTEISLTTRGNITVHIYTQTVHRLQRTEHTCI